MRTVTLHYTVGVRSDPVGKRGYFTWLVRRNGEVVQFAEADAVTYHAGEWNREGPGIEVEYHPDYDDRILPDAALDALAGLIAWLHADHGLELTYRDTPDDRIRPPSGTGFISHRSLDQAPDNHTDYVPYEDWLAMTAPVVVAVEEDSDMQAQIVPPDGKTYITDGIFVRQITSEEFRGALGTLGLIKGDPIPVNQAFFDQLIPADSLLTSAGLRAGLDSTAVVGHLGH